MLRLKLELWPKEENIREHQGGNFEAMGDCLSLGAKEAGTEDEWKPGSKVITVSISTGQGMPVWVLPSDTLNDVHKKIVRVDGKQWVLREDD